MIKKVRLEDVKKLRGGTNWHYLKSSDKSAEPSSSAPDIKQHQLNEMKRAATSQNQ